MLLNLDKKKKGKRSQRHKSNTILRILGNRGSQKRVNLVVTISNWLISMKYIPTYCQMVFKIGIGCSYDGLYRKMLRDLGK